MTAPRHHSLIAWWPVPTFCRPCLPARGAYAGSRRVLSPSDIMPEEPMEPDEIQRYLASHRLLHVVHRAYATKELNTFYRWCL